MSLPPRPFWFMKFSDKDNDTVRLQVFLSHSGVCSRRRAMELIQQGQVMVNGQLIKEPSWQISSQRDQVTVNGKHVVFRQYEYIILNKPPGYVTTTAEHRGEKTVLALLPEKLRSLKPVGRLDRDTQGLLLLTNDGNVAYRLTHPKFHVGKVYLVRIQGNLFESDRRRLEQGVVIEGKKTSPAKLTDVKFLNGQTSFQMTIHEGYKRQIRLMCKTIGHPVVSLKRLVQGPLRLGTLKKGEWRRLTGEEIKSLGPQTRVGRK